MLRLLLLITAAHASTAMRMLYNPRDVRQSDDVGVFGDAILAWPDTKAAAELVGGDFTLLHNSAFKDYDIQFRGDHWVIDGQRTDRIVVINPAGYQCSERHADVGSVFFQIAEDGTPDVACNDKHGTRRRLVELLAPRDAVVLLLHDTRLELQLTKRRLEDAIQKIEERADCEASKLQAIGIVAVCALVTVATR